MNGKGHAYGKVYPEAIASVVEDSINESTVAAAIIDLRENGAPSGYSGFDEGDTLSLEHICGIVLNGANAPRTVRALFLDIEQERIGFESVSPADYTTQGSFLQALNDISEHLSSAQWLSGLKAKHGVTTWADLRAIYTGG